MKNWWEDNSQVAAGPVPGQFRQLCLYVAGCGPRAQQAEANVRRCCDAHFEGRYELEVIDLTQHPALAQREQVLALPLLVRRLPSPRQYLVGTFTDPARLLSSLLADAGC